ncbi:DUF3017 domain-containing protein [Streptomyces sp. NPDC059247]|uniref:DUF3017 domain-containing protein n=1 Tax=Streptomyces sp. NPDC059247 TaxID=3346790 RepID=UPI0036A19C7B
MSSGTPGTSGNPDRTGGTDDTGDTDGTEGVDATETRSTSGSGGGTASGAGTASGGGTASGAGTAPGGASGPGRGEVSGGGTVTAAGSPKRRRSLFTTSTARPEGGGRAAPGNAPAPARQWPLLTVLTLAGLGLLVVGTDLFPQAFRVGTILIGIALLVGAVMRWALPSVGMLAVRSRFTDLITYGVMGGLIVMLALMVQPEPWLRIPFLEEILHLTVT